MLRKLSKKWRIIIGIVLFIVLFVAWIFWSNTALELNYMAVKSEDLPEAFDGYRIAHVSDLHNADMADDLIEPLKEAKPDIITLTGDIVDAKKPDLEIVYRFFESAVKIAPCYYVTGNHETVVENNTKYWEKMSSLGVNVVKNEQVLLTKDDSLIVLVGIDDPIFYHPEIDSESYMNNMLRMLQPAEDDFALLLSHRPELFLSYAESNIDLVLSGHAHGGQFRLPFVGGLYAPHQGTFPTYDSGLYEKNGVQMVVSRGIGNSRFPIRFNNRPEVILIELQTA